MTGAAILATIFIVIFSVFCIEEYINQKRNERVIHASTAFNKHDLRKAEEAYDKCLLINSLKTSINETFKKYTEPKYIPSINLTIKLFGFDREIPYKIFVGDYDCKFDLEKNFRTCYHNISKYHRTSDSFTDIISYIYDKLVEYRHSDGYDSAKETEYIKIINEIGKDRDILINLCKQYDEC